MTEPVVHLSDVGLAYRLFRHGAGTMKEFLIRALKRQVRYESFWALRHFSLVVEKGETVAVIGRNGAGKTTLMKVIARVLYPSEGRVVVRGSTAAMIELGVGFNGDLTARENIVMYGALLGRPIDLMRKRVDAIADWAELTEFIDTPVRSYSSGMLARLAFAVATDVDPDLLVVDEVLSVGDEAFRAKSEARIHEMIGRGASVILVSHDLALVDRMADRAVWLDRGQTMGEGPPGDVIAAYRSFLGMGSG